MDSDVTSLLEPFDQILEAVGRHPLASFRGLGIVVVEKVGRLILLATRLFGHLAVHGAAILADVEDLAANLVSLAKDGGAKVCETLTLTYSSRSYTTQAESARALVRG